MTLVIRQGGKQSGPLSGTKGSLTKDETLAGIVLSLLTCPSTSQLFALLIPKTLGSSPPLINPQESSLQSVLGAALSFLLHPLFRLTEAEISVLESERC